MYKSATHPTTQTGTILWKNEQIGVYFMFVNWHVFLVNKSFNTKLSSIKNIQVHGATASENGIKTAISAFTARKINIGKIIGDYEFGVVCKKLRPVHFEIVGADEHEYHV